MLVRDGTAATLHPLSGATAMFLSHLIDTVSMQALALSPCKSLLAPRGVGSTDRGISQSR